MKNLFLILLFPLQLLAANRYYVKNGGTDALSGLSDANAWATTGKINGFTFGINDTISFKAGSSFYGYIVIPRANLVFNSYGTGAKPIITGLSTITGWTDLGGNIWEASTSGVKVTNNLVVRDGLIMQVGRYPNTNAVNSGYLYYTAATTSSITGPALSSVTNWTGAEVAIRIARWEILRKTVTSHSAGVVSFSAHSSTPRLNYGYFFQRDSRTLDQDGEWWQDGTNNKLRMYFGNNNPTAYTIQAATIDTGMTNLPGYYNAIKIDNISFIGFGRKAIFLSGGTGHRLNQVQIKYSGAEGIILNSCVDVIIDSSSTSNCLGGGLRASYTGGNTVWSAITNSTADSTSMIAGMETSNESNGGEGIVNRALNNVYVTNCRITNTGGSGMSWYGNDAYIKYNYVDNYNRVRDDGAGIYTSEGTFDTTILVTRVNRNVVGNFVSNGIGQGDGTSNPTDVASNGIYVDDNSYDVFIDSNTIYNIPDAGLHGNNNRRITFTNNTTFNTNKGYSTQRFGGASIGRTVNGLRVTNNIFYPYRLRYTNGARDEPNITVLLSIQNIGTVDSNYYSLRVGTDTSLYEETVLKNGTGQTITGRTISYLTGTVGFETHGTYVADNTGVLYTNPSNTSIPVTFNGLSKKDVYGSVYNNSTTIAPWGSKILISNGSSPVLSGNRVRTSRRARY